MARYVVTASEDTSDGALSTGDLSLREALEFSNATTARDTVGFAPDVQQIVLGSALPTITGDLVLRGGGTVTIDAAADAETADRRVLDIDGAHSVTIAGLRLTGGRVEAAETNDVEGFGGGIRATDVANLHVVNSRIYDNVGTIGGGIAALGSTVVAVANSEVSDNGGFLSYGYLHSRGGGGIYAAGDISIVSSQIQNNRAYGNGGGVLVRGNLMLKQSIVVDNHAYDDGGGIAAAGRTIIRNSTVSGNAASQGGGIAGEFVLVVDSVIRNNGAFGRGYGYHYVATSASGGGIAASEVVVRNSEISGNTAWASDASGGGIAAETVTVRNSTIAENHAEGNRYGGYDISGGGVSAAAVTIVSSTLTGNVASVYVGAARGAAVSADSIVLRNSLVVGNTVALQGSYGGTITATASDIIGRV